MSFFSADTIAVMNIRAMTEDQRQALAKAAQKVLGPECPHCSTAMKPEHLGGNRYRCDCCSKTFTWSPR